MDWFGGLTVLSLESRRSEAMTNLITQYGGVALVAPSMREQKLDLTGMLTSFEKALLLGEMFGPKTFSDKYFLACTLLTVGLGCPHDFTAASNADAGHRPALPFQPLRSGRGTRRTVAQSPDRSHLAAGGACRGAGFSGLGGSA